MWALPPLTAIALTSLSNPLIDTLMYSLAASDSSVVLIDQFVTLSKKDGSDGQVGSVTDGGVKLATSSDDVKSRAHNYVASNDPSVIAANAGPDEHQPGSA